MTTVSSPTAPSATGGASSAGSLASGLTSSKDQEDRFMQLLVAQMKNQDPLNPMDNAQMTSQIAQINTVGGIEKLNATVQSLLGAFNSLQAQNASQLAGRGVLVEGSQLALANGGAIGGVSLAGKVDNATVEVLDAAGNVVRSIALGPKDAGVHSYAWDGKLADGSAAPDGSWRVRVRATAGGKETTATALTSAWVQSVSTASDGSVRLDLGAAGSKSLADVKSYL